MWHVDRLVHDCKRAGLFGQKGHPEFPALCKLEDQVIELVKTGVAKNLNRVRDAFEQNAAPEPIAAGGSGYLNFGIALASVAFSKMAVRVGVAFLLKHPFNRLNDYDHEQSPSGGLVFRGWCF
jgi:hypothetical protein